MGLTACQDTIEPADRYLPAETGEPCRTVLIEEYTGVDCKNCPTGHAILHDIESYYNTPENASNGAGVIAVGIHIPAFGDAVAAGGFVTPEADQLAPNQYQAPAAKIDRATEVLGTDKWLTAVAAEIVKAPKVTFEDVSASLADGKLTVSGTVMPHATLSDPKLNVWVVEDDIIDWQLQPDGEYEEHYTHHAVYRGTLTAIGGDALADNDFTVSGEIPANWKVENIRIVIFVTDNHVLNATQTKL